MVLKDKQEAILAQRQMLGYEVEGEQAQVLRVWTWSYRLSVQGAVNKFKGSRVKVLWPMFQILHAHLHAANEEAICLCFSNMASLLAPQCQHPSSKGHLLEASKNKRFGV